MTTAAMQRLVQVRLHGRLGERFGRVHHLAVETAAEAVRALCVLCKGFAEAVRVHERGFRVRVGEGERASWRDERTLQLGIGQAQRIDIVPVTHGRKRNGTGQVIVGAIMVVVGIVANVYGQAWGTPLAKAGWMMVAGGVVALLTPMPKGSDSKAAREASGQIDGPGNITSAGGPVPLVIGRMLVGSVTISAGISTAAVAVQTTLPSTPTLPVDEPPYWDVHY